MNTVQQSSVRFGSLISIALILFCLIDPINNHVHRRRHVITDNGNDPTTFGKRLKRLEPLTTAAQTLQPSESTLSTVSTLPTQTITPGTLEPISNGSKIYINHLPISTTTTTASSNNNNNSSSSSSTTSQINTDATTVSPAATTLVPPPTGNSATSATFSVPIIDQRNYDLVDPSHNHHHHRNIRNRTGMFFRRKPLFIRDHCEELKHFVRNFREDHDHHHGQSIIDRSEVQPKEVQQNRIDPKTIQNVTVASGVEDYYSNVTTVATASPIANTTDSVLQLANNDGDHEQKDQVTSKYGAVNDDTDDNDDDGDGDHTVSESINNNRYVVAYDHPYPTTLQEKILRQPKLVDNLLAMSNELPPLTAALPMEYLHEANALHPDHHQQRLNPSNHLKPDSEQHLFNTATLMEQQQQQQQQQPHFEHANLINEPPHSHEHHKIPAHYFESIVQQTHPIPEPHPEIHLVAQNGGQHNGPIEQQIIHPTPEQQHALEQALIMVNHLKHHQQQQQQQQQQQPGLIAHPVQLEQSIPIALDHVANVDGGDGLAIQAQLHHQQHHHTIHHNNYIELIGPQHLGSQGVNVVDKAAHLSAALGILDGGEHSPPPPPPYDPSEHIPGIPGKPWKDYPIYSSVPKTSFHCSVHHPGYYADVEAGCQVWHYCQPDGRHDSFLCANGTLFNQKTRVCDWWHNVDCKHSIQYYGVNHDLYAHSDHPVHPSQILVGPLPTILTHNAEQIHLIRKKKK